MCNGVNGDPSIVVVQVNYPAYKELEGLLKDVPGYNERLVEDGPATEQWTGYYKVIDLPLGGTFLHVVGPYRSRPYPIGDAQSPNFPPPIA